MASLIRSHYDPFTEFELLFDDAFNDRFRTLFSSVKVRTCPHHQSCTTPQFIPSKNGCEIIQRFRHRRRNIQTTQRKGVSGESAASRSHDGTGYTVRERRYGKFSRTLQLPFGTKPEDVKTHLENGLLAVTFPKMSPE